MSPDLSLTLTGAFVTGLMTSFHCMGMCGPLACMACQRPGSCSNSNSAALYQGGRLLAYTTVGMLAGAFGGTLAGWLPDQMVNWLFWAVGGAVILFALGWAFGWEMPLRPAWKLPLRSKAGPGVVGLATPLIPCGPLYMVFAICSLTGSPVRGGALALSFGLGTLPLLWLAQHQWWRVQKWVGQRGATILQRVLVLLTAAVVLWRLQAGEGMGIPDCCHTAVVP